MLTAIAAIMGMIPLITNSFWGPMAAAMSGGILIATILTLLVLPVIYATWYKVGKELGNQAILDKQEEHE